MRKNVWMNYLAEEILEELEKGYLLKKQVMKKYGVTWSERSIQYALRTLRLRGQIEHFIPLTDARQRGYRIKKVKEDVFITEPVEVE